MDREIARQEIRKRINCTDYLERSKSGMYCCPFCGSGHNGNETGAVKYYPETNTICCFGGCEKKSYDIIDIYKQKTGADYNRALNELANQIGISIDKYNYSAGAPTRATAPHNNTSTPPEHKSTTESAEKPVTADYIQYYMQCADRIKTPAALSYLAARGISEATAEAYLIGFDPAADPASAPGEIGDKNKPHPVPRIIIPVSESFYIARRIDGETKFKVSNPAGASAAIFNEGVLYKQGTGAIFVTEAVFDALSIIEAGATAIALNSTSNVDLLLKQLEEQPTKATMILCMDNDAAGEKATERLRTGLNRLNIKCAVVPKSFYNEKKDANESLTANREAFFSAVKEFYTAIRRPDSISYYIDNLMSRDISRFKNEIKTGFTDLDYQSSGVYSGLYVIAAISSLGKTTFALQIADQMAAAGEEVLFFSMEQSRLELVSKSIARTAFKHDRGSCVSSLSIRKGYATQEVYTAAAQYKQEVQERISIIEGNFNCNISFISKYINEHIERTGRRPVVFIDYLQVLQPEQDAHRQTVKESIDNAITELKRLSRLLDIPIFVISSVNRANYLTPIDFESLKESGNIEFTADVIWGLQLQCIDRNEFDKQNNIKERREIVKKAKSETPRKIKLVCLKNRYGKATFDSCFNYYPANDYFEQSVMNPDCVATSVHKAGRKL